MINMQYLRNFRAFRRKDGTSVVAGSFSGLKQNLVFVFLTALFILGMIYGVLLISAEGRTLEALRLFTGEYTDGLREKTLLQSFGDSFGSVFLFVLIPYLLGYSAIGQPAALLLPFFKGLGLGAFLGSLYQEYGFQGLGYSALIIVPYTLPALLGLFVACRESIRLSNLFFSGFSSKEPGSVTRSVIKLYNIKFLVLCVIVLISAVIHTVCVLVFAGLFRF